MQMKICSWCLVPQEVSLFYKLPRGKDGLHPTCKSCLKKRNAEWYVANKERARQNNKKWAKENPEKSMVRHARFDARWPGRKAARSARNYLANRDAARARHARWASDNKDRMAAYTARRRAQKINATPPWVDQAAITQIYTDAARRGLEVDHIHPLIHPRICGLHVPWNLQLLTAVENRRKGNRFP